MKMVMVKGSLFVAVLMCVTAMVTAQQQYNNSNGYACTGARRTCSTYAFYRTFQADETLQRVGGYFNKTPAAVSNVSGLNGMATTAPLRQGQALYIPLDCSCQNVTTQMEVSHTIAKGDTFWLLSVTIYGGLTKYQAMMVLNPTLDVYNLNIGDVIRVGVFCACPTTAQVADGTNFLVTYSVYPGETLAVISNYFGISTASLAAANSLSDLNAPLGDNTTLLVPLATLPPVATLDLGAGVAPPPPNITAGPPAAAAGPAEVVREPASYTPLYIGIAVGAFGLTLAAVMLGTLLLARKKGVSKAKEYESGDYYNHAASGETKALQKSAHLEILAGMSDMVGSDKPVLLSFKELQDATRDFSDENLIQGSVYRGVLGGRVVAIKQMKGNMSQELKILCQVHHSNLVKLVGMCVGGSEHLYLVYEYAENGSLNDCLRNQAAIGRDRFTTQSATYLPWTVRVRIALDVASGLEYIHNYTNPSFVHKDVKSSNILLDARFRAKVANFGMAKSASAAAPQLTRHITGTQGYMAPEYLEHGLVTVKADVFAYGVVLLEILSGKEAIVRDNGERALSEIIHDVLDDATAADQSQRLRQFLDPQLHSAYPLDVALSVTSLARTCVDTDPALRPSMKDVTFALCKMLAASQDWETSAGYDSGLSTISIEAR